MLITPREINALGVCMTVPIASGGAFTQDMGLAVPITGHDTNGVAVCNQVRSFDAEARVRGGTARFVETIDQETAEEVVTRVLSVIDPDP